MADKTIAIYCFLDDFFWATGRKTDVHCKLNDAEIATTALIAALYFHGNQASAMGYMHKHHGLRKLDKSGFNVCVRACVLKLKRLNVLYER